MGELSLITGGSRSGKSGYAQQTAELLPGPRYFIATCQVCDEEMAARVMKHQEARGAGEWLTIEEPFDLAGALRAAAKGNVLLVDCLTIWINNLLYEAEKNGELLTATGIAAVCQEVLTACRELEGTVIFVTGEVGMGIVPDNPLARLYRDCVGTCNQLMAAAADRVTLVACGLPLFLKG